MMGTRRSLAILFLAPAFVSIAATKSCAQDNVGNSVHWAYSSYFGTGWYRIDNQRNVFVLRTTPRWELREPAIAEDGTRTMGIEFRLPVTAGLNSFILDDIAGTVDPDNLASISIAPGVDVTIPLTSRWSLRPFASVGWGTVVNDSESAWTYWAGVKSRYAFQHGKLNWSLQNSLAYVGYSPSEGPSEDFWPLMAGLEFSYPIRSYWPDGGQLILNWHGMYTTFEDNLDLVLEDATSKSITDQWEFGLALSKKDRRIKMWWFSFDRLGLAYRFSSSRDLTGISVVFRSVFER